MGITSALEKYEMLSTTRFLYYFYIWLPFQVQGIDEMKDRVVLAHRCLQECHLASAWLGYGIDNAYVCTKCQCGTEWSSHWSFSLWCLN